MKETKPYPNPWIFARFLSMSQIDMARFPDRAEEEITGLIDALLEEQYHEEWFLLKQKYNITDISEEKFVTIKNLFSYICEENGESAEMERYFELNEQRIREAGY